MTGEKKASATKYHRKALMTAADRLLVEHGYDGMNMNMLAKEANYSKATVYVYFESKDEIVAALAAERLELMIKELALVVKSDLDTDEKFAEVERILTELATEDKVYFDFTCNALGSKTEEQLTVSEGRLHALVLSALDALSPLGDRSELLSRWYAFYGRIKTANMFAGE